MASKIVFHANASSSDSHTSRPSGSITSSSSASLASSAHASSSTATHSVPVQRMLKTSSGTQIYFSALPTNTSSSLKRSLPAAIAANDHHAQPPTKIKVTYNTINANVPISNSVPPAKAESKLTVTSSEQKPSIIIRAADPTRSPIRATGSVSRKLILSPVKQSTGGITMVPLNTSVAGSTSGKFVGLSRTPSGGRGSFSNVKAVHGLSASPTKLVIKSQDMVSFFVSFQRILTILNYLELNVSVKLCSKPVD